MYREAILEATGDCTRFDIRSLGTLVTQRAHRADKLPQTATEIQDSGGPWKLQNLGAEPRRHLIRRVVLGRNLSQFEIAWHRVFFSHFGARCCAARASVIESASACRPPEVAAIQVRI